MITARECLEVLRLAEPLFDRYAPLRARLDACNPRWPSHVVGITQIRRRGARFDLVATGDERADTREGETALVVPAFGEAGRVIDVIAFSPVKLAPPLSYRGAAWCLGEERIHAFAYPGGALPVFVSFWEALAADFQGCLVVDRRRAIVEFYLRGVVRVAAADDRAGERLLDMLSGRHLTPQILVREDA